MPSGAWKLLSSWETANLILSVAVTCATALLAYSVYADYEEKQNDYDILARRLSKVENKFERSVKVEPEKQEAVPFKQAEKTDGAFLAKYLKERAEKQAKEKS